MKMEQKNFRKFGIRDQVGYFFGDLAGSMVNLYIGAFFLMFATYVLGIIPLPQAPPYPPCLAGQW